MNDRAGTDPVTPWDRYRADLAGGGFVSDAEQARAARALDELHRALARRRPWWQWLPWLRRRPAEPVPGLYLWGGVGRGKTYLMDVFYDSLPRRDKLRAHFHAFMRDVHGRLRQVRRHRDPLVPVADRIADRARVICLDELAVTDIADAMLLGTLLRQLFRRGVTLVTTSNIPPGELYRGGLQRERFLPAIELLEQHCRVHELGGETDFRLRTLERAEIYYWPLDERADAQLERYFRQLAPETPARPAQLTIEGRAIPARALAEDVVWFDFQDLCEGPRSQNDYLELARCYHTVLLGGVPVLDGRREDAARRLVSLVDVLYDHGVKLIVAADAAPEELYTGTRLRGLFQRTVSRLREMQSKEYLAGSHRP